MANIHDAFPSKYLRATDLGGASPVVTIDRVDFEPVGRTREMKGVVYFVGKNKGLVLNKTNATKIAEVVGSPETDEWAGGKVQLYATEVEFQGEAVETIRCKAPTIGRKPAPKPAPAPVVEDADTVNLDEIPF
jgi:hypothetical protein